MGLTPFGGNAEVRKGLPSFDFPAFFGAFDAERQAKDLGWYEFADQLWEQSAELNVLRDDHPLCGGAVSRLGRRGETSCQYALFMLRWLGRSPKTSSPAPWSRWERRACPNLVPVIGSGGI